MAKMRPQDAIHITALQKAIEKENIIKAQAKARAEEMIAAEIADAVTRTNILIEDALRDGMVLAHIHNIGLGTKNSKRVYDVKNSMDWTPQEPALESVKVKHYGWNEEPEVAWFETSTGMIERVQIPLDYQNEPLVAESEEESALIAANRELFVEALTKFYGN